MSETLITVPPPGRATPDTLGLSSYRTEVVSVEVHRRGPGDVVLDLQIGAAQARLDLNEAAQRHLAALLLGEVSQ